VGDGPAGRQCRPDRAGRARPKGETRLEIVEDLLDSAEDLVHVDNVLMDREFDSQHVLEMISQRGLSYVVPKRMQTSEKAQAKRLLQRDQDRYETNRKLHLGKNEWHETTLIYRRKEDSDHDDHRQYSVFMTNCGSGHLTEYGYRWEIESGYKSIKRFMAATTSKNFGLRFFLLRVRMPTVLNLASGRSTRTGRIDR